MFTISIINHSKTIKQGYSLIQKFNTRREAKQYIKDNNNYWYQYLINKI
jgi:hypothetical protein